MNINTIKTKKFESAGRNGYRADEVNVFLSSVVKYITGLEEEKKLIIQDKNRLTEKLRQSVDNSMNLKSENAKYEKDMRNIAEAFVSATNFSNEVKNKADKEAANIINSAKNEANTIKSSAENQAAEIIATSNENAEKIIAVANEKGKLAIAEANKKIADMLSQYEEMKFILKEFKTETRDLISKVQSISDSINIDTKFVDQVQFIQQEIQDEIVKTSTQDDESSNDESSFYENQNQGEVKKGISFFEDTSSVFNPESTLPNSEDFIKEFMVKYGNNDSDATSGF